MSVPKVTARMGALPAARRDLWIFAAILIFATGLRAWYIPQPLVDIFSWREASTAMMADNFRLSSWNIFYPEVSWTGPGPSYQGREFQLFTYLVAILHALFGWHDWVGRLVAVGFGLVTVFSLHRLAALVWDEVHAHATALAYAVLPAAVVIDSSFLPDPSMLALVTLGIWLFLRYWIGGSARNLIFGALAFTLGVLAKLPGLAAGWVVLWLIVVWIARGDHRRALSALAACALGLGAVIAYYAWAIHLGNSYPPYHVAGSGYIWDTGVATFWADAFYLPKVWGIATWWFYGYAVMTLMAVGLWMSISLFDSERDAALVAVPLVWLCGGVLVYLAGAREISNNPWNLHILHVPIAFLAGRGIVTLCSVGRIDPVSLGGGLRAAAILGIVLITCTIPLVGHVKAPANAAAQELGRDLDRLAGPTDLVIAVSPEVGDPIAIYYSRRRGWVFPPGGGSSDWSVFLEDGPGAIESLEELRRGGARWFGVTYDAMDRNKQSFFDHHGAFIAHLEAIGERVSDTQTHVIFRLKDPQ